MSTARRLILITGSNVGIGFECARQLLASASNHVIICSRTPSKGEEALRDLQDQRLPGYVQHIKLDVNQTEDIAAAAKYVEQEFGR